MSFRGLVIQQIPSISSTVRCCWDSGDQYGKRLAGLSANRGEREKSSNSIAGSGDEQKKLILKEPETLLQSNGGWTYVFHSGSHGTQYSQRARVNFQQANQTLFSEGDPVSYSRGALFRFQPALIGVTAGRAAPPGDATNRSIAPSAGGASRSLRRWHRPARCRLPALCANARSISSRGRPFARSPSPGSSPGNHGWYVGAELRPASAMSFCRSACSPLAADEDQAIGATLARQSLQDLDHPPGQRHLCSSRPSSGGRHGPDPLSKSISYQRAFSTSPVLEAVKMMNSSAAGRDALTLRSAWTNAGTSP